MKGLIQLYIGNGKGKTTAAIGQSIRACAAGKKIFFAQLLKDDRGNELKILKNLSGITVAAAPKSLPFWFQMSEEQKREYREFAKAVFDEAKRRAFLAQADVVVLDEIIDAVDLGVIDRAEFIEFLLNKPVSVELVLTGHKADEEIVGLCDYVSEVRAIKHPFDRGIPAREGIEF